MIETVLISVLCSALVGGFTGFIGVRVSIAVLNVEFKNLERRVLKLEEGD